MLNISWIFNRSLISTSVESIIACSQSCFGWFFPTETSRWHEWGIKSNVTRKWNFFAKCLDVWYSSEISIYLNTMICYTALYYIYKIVLWLFLVIWYPNYKNKLCFIINRVWNPTYTLIHCKNKTHFGFVQFWPCSD